MSWYNFLAIEGPIGVGKTSLAKSISKRFDAKLICEHNIDNPFLKDFYLNPERFAFQTQIYFLLIRYKTQLELGQRDLFHKLIVSDFIFQKDRIFASVTLNEREFDLYNKIAGFFEREI
ncbi:deoxynucleoside kinase [candidate division KSB1 bacterium]